MIGGSWEFMYSARTATELVHIGQTLMAFNGTVDHLVETVFNYPTLAESYKVAALDATNKLRTISTVSASAALGT